MFFDLGVVSGFGAAGALMGVVVVCVDFSDEARGLVAVGVSGSELVSFREEGDYGFAYGGESEGLDVGFFDSVGALSDVGEVFPSVISRNDGADGGDDALFERLDLLVVVLLCGWFWCGLVADDFGLVSFLRG